MALITSKDYKRLDIPHEPGAWIEVRPLTFGDLDMFGMDGETVRVSRELAAEVIMDWSYGEWPASAEQRIALLKALDLDTAIWLITALGETLSKISGIRGDSEKKDSASSSLPITSMEADSPQSSPILSSSED